MDLKVRLFFKPKKRRPIGLSRLPALNNEGVKAGRKERRKECSLLGQTSVPHSRQDKSRSIKHVKRCFNDLLQLIGISRVLR